MLLATVAAIGLSIGAAQAGEGDGPVANTWFTQLPGFLAQAPVQKPQPSTVADSQNRSTMTYVTNNRSAISLFSNHYEGGANN